MVVTSMAEKYTYRVGWSEEDCVHVAHCLEFPSLTAHGDTAKDALANIVGVVDESIKWLAQDNEPIPKPFGMKERKGKMRLAVP